MKRWTCRIAWCVMVVGIWVLGMASHSVSASNATGQITINTQDMAQFAYAYAIVEPNPYDDTQDNVVVILADQPFSDEAVEDEWTRKNVARENGMKYVEIVIASDETTRWVQFFNMHLDPSGSSYQEMNGVGDLELTVFDGNNVEGRFYANGETDASDNLYQFDFTFQTAIRGGKDAPQIADAANAGTTTASSDIDEDRAALSPEEKFERTVADIEKIAMALQIYNIDYGLPSSPSEQLDLSELGLDDAHYREQAYEGDLKDAWGTPLKYMTTTEGKWEIFILTSYGADTVAGDGGGAFDADIVFRGSQFVAPPRLVQE